MADRIKLTDVVKPFSGNVDFAEWVSKFELACELRNFNDGRHKLLPMFLEGPAFAVYKQLTDRQRGDYDELRDCLLGAFSENCFAAYNTLQSRKLQVRESVDVYLADLKRLMTLCEKGSVPPGMLRCAFVAGLPPDVRSQVLSQPDATTKSAEELLPMVKSIVSAVGEEFCAVGRVAARPIQQPRVGGRRTVACYKCGVEGHIARNCESAVVREGTSCFRCGSASHYVRDCPAPAPVKGNDKVGASSAPAASTY